jgi:hypothetical protein
MTRKPVPAAITKEGLLGKSKVYVRRAFRAKAASDFDEYQLWASLALELLGKAALSEIHPSLVVDPTHYESLFAATGIQIGADIKTIAAGTLYKRIAHLSKFFDAKVKEFCDTISIRRNAELHSGELPFQQMRLEAWEGRYWHAAQIILDLMGSSLEEWVGADEAQSPRHLVKALAEAIVQASMLRVEQAKEHFNVRPKKEREEAITSSKTKRAFDYPKIFRLQCDEEWEVECPACTGQAFLAGFLHGEEVLDTDVEEEEVEKYYVAEELRCPVCGLHLDSRAEIDAAGVDADHNVTELRDRQYEPDYGNC